MPTVEVPEGTVDFPDSMSQSEIESALNEHYSGISEAKAKLAGEMAKVRRERFLTDQEQAAIGAAQNIARVAAIPATPILKLPRSEGTGVGAGLLNLGAGAAEGISAPAYWMLPASRPLQALIAGQTAGNIPESTVNAIKTLTNPEATKAQKVEAVGNPILQTAVAAAITKGANAANKVKGTSGLPPEQQSVPPERPTEGQAETGTPQRGGEGEQPLPQPTEVQKEVEKVPSADEAGKAQPSAGPIDSTVEAPVPAGETPQAMSETATPEQPKQVGSVTQPVTESVGPEAKRRFMVAPDPEVLSQASRDLQSINPLIGHKLTQSARGVVVGAPTPVDSYFSKAFDNRVEESSFLKKYRDEEGDNAANLYNTFEGSRALLRQKYGDTVTLWRAQGQGKHADIELSGEGKNTLNFASKEGAKLYMRDPGGRQLIAKAVPVDDIVSIHSPNGNYEEYIVLNKKSPDLLFPPKGYRVEGNRLVKTEPPPQIQGMGGAISEGPGAASPGDVPQGSQLAQLTEAIGTQLSPNKPLGERISSAVNIADKWAKGRDAATQGIAKARAASQALIDSYLNLPKWTNFRDAIGKWTSADQETALEVYKFQKQIMKAVPDRLRQEAITNWIQADGDEALLRSRAEASKPNVRRGYELALQLTPAEKTLARNVSSYLDARLQEGIGAGLLKQGVDNYVTQVWKRSNEATKKLWADLFGVGTLNPNFKFARKRIFDSYFEGEQAGYTPKNKTIGNLVSQYDLSFNRALSARALIKRLQEGTAEDGKPITMTSGKTSIVSDPSDIPEAFLIKPNMAPEGAVSADGRPYRPIDHWALRDWKWATKGPNGEPVFVQGDMLVHPDHWEHLNNVLKTSRLRANPITGPILKASALAKQTKLSISPFHTVQEGVHAAAHRVNPFSPGEIDLSNPIDKTLVDHGLMVMDPRAEELFAEGSSGGGLVGKIPGLGRLQQWYTEMTFKDYIPRLKMTMAKDALERNLTAYAKDIASGKVTKDQIIDLTARESNAAFGEQNYKMMGRSPNVQDVLRLALLAPDFLEARFRFVGQALKPYGREQRIALALMFGALYTAARVMNKAGDDDYHWNKPFSVFYKGKEYRLRTLLGDVEHLITDPRSFWYNRLSPISRTVSEYVTGRDDRGIKRSSVEQFKDFLSWFKPIPLQTRSDQTITQAVLGSAGVPSKTYTKQQEVYELADKWMANNKDPKVAERYNQLRQETMPDSPYRPLRDALRKDDLKAAKAEYQKLRQTRTFGTISTAIKHNRPFTGSYASEQKFRASLNDEQRKIYDQAIKERRELYSKFLKSIQP